MHILRKLIDNFEEYACALLMAIMIFCLVVQVFIRFCFGSALAWTEELSRFSFIWTVYVGAALCVKRHAHVRITAQFMKLSIKWRLAFRFICDVIWIAFNIFIIYQSVEVLIDGLEYPEISPTLHVVKAWVEAIIPFSFTLMSVRLLQQYYIHYKSHTLADLVNYEEIT